MNAESTSSEFQRLFAERADSNAILRFDLFMELALYNPVVGYYRADRPRVGYGSGTDFFTSSTSGPVFGELVVAACSRLLGGRSASQHAFIEIGAESPEGVLRGVSHPFRDVRTIRVGETLEIAGPAVVFSNELLDAQPFRRFRFDGIRWNELAVRLHDGALAEVTISTADLPDFLELPQRPPEGYTIDAPIAATTLTAIIARQKWTGLFVAFDYGKSWQEIAEACPAGTGRAYFRHTQNNALLARAGEQDLTCHVCWDWIATALRNAHFNAPELETQESFFIHHAEHYLGPAIAEDAGRLTPRKQSLLQLLHGAHLGQKFQVLHALR